MSRPNFGHDAHREAELAALTTQAFQRLRKGDTLPTSGVYKRMMKMLEQVAADLGDHPELPLKSVNEWLALALFAKDRAYFVKLCQTAAIHNDPIYHRGEYLLRKIIDEDKNTLAGGRR